MALWFLLGLMTVAAIFAVLWPLGRQIPPMAGGGETAVYRDQLAEIDRDREQGMIGIPEAEAARIEIGRRLLNAADSARDLEPRSSLGARRMVAIVALIGVPLLALALYLPLGSPQMRDFPLAERTKAPLATASLDQLIEKVEQHLETNPTDGRGWSVLAPVLTRVGRYDDAARAFHNAIRYDGDSATRRADLGEALVGAANGIVTADAKMEFERAIALDPDEAKARYFTGIAALQDGRKDDAAAIWRAMLAKAPADAPWRSAVQGALARVDGSTVAPALSDDTVASTKDMSDADRSAMIHGMVQRLATRLKQDSGDVTGWLRLVRAYMVLGERDHATQASAEARQALAHDSDRLRELNDGLKTLGLDG